MKQSADFWSAAVGLVGVLVTMWGSWLLYDGSPTDYGGLAKAIAGASNLSVENNNGGGVTFNSGGPNPGYQQAIDEANSHLTESRRGFLFLLMGSCASAFGCAFALVGTVKKGHKTIDERLVAT